MTNDGCHCHCADNGFEGCNYNDSRHRAKKCWHCDRGLPEKRSWSTVRKYRRISPHKYLGHPASIKKGL